jgi:biopolymer transport protein ExbB
MLAIAALSLLMWGLILDRYWFLARDLRPQRDALLERWRGQYSRDPAIDRQLRRGLAGDFKQRVTHHVPMIQMITAILPLLGLLGTVTGMIKTFDAMAVFGTGNVRGMAEGISQALLTTMAGLLTALSGLYFASNLQARIDDESERLVEQLVAPEPAPPETP